MNLEVKIDQAEFSRLANNLRKLKGEFKPSTMRKIFIKAARPVVAEIKSRAPQGKTGKLKRAIGVLPFLGVRTGSVFIGLKRERGTKKVAAWYGKLLEFGTKFIPKGKFTFFWPGVQAGINAAYSRVISELKTAIGKYAR